jgi:hypothetical protein
MVKIHVHSNFSLNNVAQEFYAVTLFRELLTNLHDDLVRNVFQPLLILLQRSSNPLIWLNKFQITTKINNKKQKTLNLH